MLRSLFSGVTGMRAHQTMMDVVGNNIANVNTAGYKSSQVVFEDTLSQMLKAAGAPQPGAAGTSGSGGTNPAQVGLGVNIGAIVTNYAQGATQLTGRSTDMAIQGDGFFAVRKEGETLYTRAGAFSFDSDGTLVTPEGAAVQGWMAKPDGTIDTNAAVQDIVLPMGQALPPYATGKIVMNGNLPNDATAGDPSASPAVAPTTISRSITVYDGQGKAYSAAVSYAYKGADTTATPPVDQWDVSLTLKDSSGKDLTNGSPISVGTVDFSEADGTLTSSSPLTVDLTSLGITSLKGFDLDVSGMTQMGADNTVEATSQDGYTMGSLQSFTISPDGTLVGVFSNGLKQPLGQIALVGFNNPPGLEKVGNSMLRSSVNSGNPQLGVAGSAGRGTLASGTLEMSNVDLAQEFTNLIVAERGFQANSKVITTSDEILQDLVNLKR